MSSGPITLFDKSALQSLNVDEAVWFDNFYRTVISPLFFVETPADLSKEVAAGRTPEQVVGSIAAKTPETGSIVSVGHWHLRLADLDGYPIEMNQRPHIAQGRRFQVDGRDGAFFDNPPEMVAFARWQRGDFLGVERDFARQWRNALSTMDLTNFYPIVRSLGGGGKAKLRNLDEAKALAEEMVCGNGRRYTTLKVAFEMLAIPPDLRPRILKRWKDAGGPRLDEFAPYAAYNLLVDLFFYLCLDAGLISSERPSNRVDVAYLYYLPFCMIFTSGDNLHRRITPYFLRADQMFMWAPDLKADLGRLDARYAALPDEVKAQGIGGFAPCPPPDGDCLTTQLWDRFLPRWREPAAPASEGMKGKIQTLVKAVSEAKRSGARLGQSVSSMPGELEDLDHVVLSRLVRGYKGKWQILPSELLKKLSEDQTPNTPQEDDLPNA